MSFESWTFEYTGTVQNITFLTPGVYKFQAYGASGGSIAGYIGGYGGYSVGEFVLEKAPLKIFIAVGGQGSTTIDNTSLWANGGFNGGGKGYPSGGNTSNTQASGGGGGATHIALEDGILSSLSSKRDSILIVAGGGGGCGVWGGGAKTNGGNGGGLSGQKVNNGNFTLNPGTQTSGYGFGVGGSGNHADSGGGGGGFYGGYANTVKDDPNISGGAGGSGYLRSDLLNASTDFSTHTGNGLVVIDLIEIFRTRKNSNFYRDSNHQSVYDFLKILGE